MGQTDPVRELGADRVDASREQDGRSTRGRPTGQPLPRATAGARECAALNAQAVWRALAAARGHRVVDEPGWLAVHSGEDAGGTRVLLHRPVAGVQRAALDEVVACSGRPLTVEDPFATLDLHAQGLVPFALPVMVAGPLTPAQIPPQGRPGIAVSRVRGPGRLLAADRIMVEGFPLRAYQAGPPGRMLPAELLDMPHVAVFVAEVRGVASGVCLTVKDEYGTGGVYWVALLPAQRRAGVGRALMRAAMRELAGMPMVLCATRQGAPLYRQLGFETAFESTWWQGVT